MKQLNSFTGCSNAIDLLKRYKQLAMQLHPSRGGSMDVMKRVYQDYLVTLKSDAFNSMNLSEDLLKDLSEFPGLIKELLTLNLELEMCGSWLWISGNTFDHREKLKSLGLRYSPNKRMWYFRPSGQSSHSSSPMDMTWIRTKYGSDAASFQREPELQKDERVP